MKEKMSSSVESTALLLTDDANNVKKKINTHAFSGGQQTKEEQLEKGANLEIDIAYQWLRFFLEDDKKLLGNFHGSPINNVPLKKFCSVTSHEITHFPDEGIHELHPRHSIVPFWCIFQRVRLAARLYERAMAQKGTTFHNSGQLAKRCGMRHTRFLNAATYRMKSMKFA